jgi:5-methylcytosine-specific restriction enzyme B
MTMSPPSLGINLQDILQRIYRWFPGWSGFSDEKFNQNEIEYKQRTVERARDVLGENALRNLLSRGEYDEFLVRVQKIGQDNNLLFRGVPSSGDLNILYQSGLEKSSFCTSFFHLLYGEGRVEERLGNYLRYVSDRSLPNKWTFPTYFLMFVHPDTELFIKPSAIRKFLKLIGQPEVWEGTPSGDGYGRIRDVAWQLRDVFKDFGPRDMIDIQSVIWVAATAEETSAESLLSDKRDQFEQLLQECLTTYPMSKEGLRHVALFSRSRDEARANFAAIVAAADSGQDITDRVLLQLLPHVDTAPNKARGAWITWAPTVTKDIRSWFEGAGLKKPDEWPAVASALFRFVRRCVEHPEELAEACREFVNLPLSKGFQTGMLSPVLNALEPESFALVNNKSRKGLNYFNDNNFKADLADYPETNAALLALTSSLSEQLTSPELPNVSPSDMFDMFCHWLVAVKNFEFGTTQYWKIAPGEEARFWDEWRDSGFMAMGWREFGDLSGLTKVQFNAKRDLIVQEHPEYTKQGTRQLWQYTRIAEGDRVIANRGKTEILGVGTVVGPYYFEADAEYPHRFPVQWDDLTPRRVNEQGWGKTLEELEPAKFRALIGARPTNGTSPRADAAFGAKSFELLAELHDNPTSAFYSSHKEDLQRLVEDPLEDLLRSVASQLPEAITDVMETEKKIFARILKNDYGRGGAWDFYWGAFYPKGGKRTEDAQLFLWINHECVRFGFYIGTYGSNQRARFLRNANRDQVALSEKLRSTLSNGRYDFGALEGGYGGGYGGGARKESTSAVRPAWDEWLRDPSKAGVQVAITLKREEAILRTKAELQEEILETFKDLFPLVLLATSDSPMLELERYLEGGEDDPINPLYPLEKLAQDTSYDPATVREWLRAIDRKGQAIIYGPPGTGKTFLAKRLAEHLVGGTDGEVDLVQFHPAYAYEDFMQGIRPQSNGSGPLEYPLVAGRFLEFCRTASSRKGPCVLIIDEINRANLSRVLGELMYLLEYRDEDVALASGNKFRVPSNVRIIGTMNTADRSIALVDHALRRRFAFIPLTPNYETLRLYHKQNGITTDGLIGVLQQVNKLIGDPHYEIGISFFLRPDLSTELESIWRMEIEPYLEEFFFDQPQKLADLRWSGIHGRLGL